MENIRYLRFTYLRFTIQVTDYTDVMSTGAFGKAHRLHGLHGFYLASEYSRTIDFVELKVLTDYTDVMSTDAFRKAHELHELHGLAAPNKGSPLRST